MRPVVQVHSGPHVSIGPIAQLGERLPCKQEVSGSIPLGSTLTSAHFARTFVRRSLTTHEVFRKVLQIPFARNCKQAAHAWNQCSLFQERISAQKEMALHRDSSCESASMPEEEDTSDGVGSISNDAHSGMRNVQQAMARAAMQYVS